MSASSKVQRTVTFTIHYDYPWCYDDDSPSGINDHILNWSSNSDTIDVRTDKEAQLAALNDKYYQKESCYHDGRRAYPTKIEKTIHEQTDDGFERTTTKTIPLPISRKCSCGKVYWPIKGAKACHKLVRTK